MLQMMYPDEYLESTYQIDFEEMYNKGYRGVLFDIDNTLVDTRKSVFYYKYKSKYKRATLWNYETNNSGGCSSCFA